MDRGRITIADVVYITAALVAFAALVPVLIEQVNLHTASMSRGQELLVLGTIPLMLIVMLTLYYVKAIGGTRY